MYYCSNSSFFPILAEVIHLEQRVPIKNAKEVIERFEQCLQAHPKVEVALIGILPLFHVLMYIQLCIRPKCQTANRCKITIIINTNLRKCQKTTDGSGHMKPENDPACSEVFF